MARPPPCTTEEHVPPGAWQRQQAVERRESQPHLDGESPEQPGVGARPRYQQTALRPALQLLAESIQRPGYDQDLRCTWEEPSQQNPWVRLDNPHPLNSLSWGESTRSSQCGVPTPRASLPGTMYPGGRWTRCRSRSNWRKRAIASPE